MKKGFTLIELLAVIIILGVLLLIAIPAVFDLINNSRKNAFKQTGSSIATLAKANYFDSLKDGEIPIDVEFSYNDGVETSNVSGKTLNYTGKKPENGIVSVNANGDVAIALHDGTFCAYKSYIDKDVVVEKKKYDECNYYYSSSKKVNTPVLSAGMNPVKWNGNDWIETTESDNSWYDYDKKIWANARTADGSFWVWIPRYVYRITTNWNSNFTGNIDLQFSKGINDDWNFESIGGLNANSSSSASNNTWTNHPAFKFGTVDIAGIWVAKFEPTASEGIGNPLYISGGGCSSTSDNVITKTVKIVPNAISWRCISIDNSFLLTRNMESNDIYGWGNSGNGIDTHMMKNVEWGAVAYLSKSIYGKYDNEIWTNPSSNFITGCAGSTISSSETPDCIHRYDSENGIKASTSGTIYGIYDTSGGAWDRVTAYVGNSSSDLLNTGANILSSNIKYRDVYSVSGSDSEDDNFLLTRNFKGDSMYETSLGSGILSWYGDASYMSYGNQPWIRRGGRFSDRTNNGIFHYSSTSGSDYSDITFRPVLIVNENL